MEWKEDKPSRKNCQKQLSHPSLSHIEQGLVWFMEKFKLNKIEQKPQIFVNLSFNELCDSKLSDLHRFDNMVIIYWVKNRSETERYAVTS